MGRGLRSSRDRMGEHDYPLTMGLDSKRDWFTELVGFPESADSVRRHLAVDGEFLVSSVNGRRLRCGRFSTPSLAELRVQAAPIQLAGRGSVREIVGDAAALHADPAASGATFQAASQFNALEMTSPTITPEAGVTGYAHDHTQGPACAMACGAGTIVRNYFVPVGADGAATVADHAVSIGQTATSQIDAFAPLAAALGIDSGMRNGYALPTGAALDAAAEQIGSMTTAQREDLMGTLRIPVHANTEVTAARRGDTPGHLVTQVYASAFPIGYSDQRADRWEPLAKLVLDALYEGTLAAATINAHRTGNPSVYLTAVGGGVFGNPRKWVLSAIERALALPLASGLDVMIVSHGSSKPDIQALTSR